MMQSHLDHTRAETAAIRAETAKARQTLDGLGSAELPSAPEPVEPVVVDETSDMETAKRETMECEHEAWASADALF